jgi:hypothetical protein
MAEPNEEIPGIDILPRPAPRIAPPLDATKRQPLLVPSADSVQPAPVVITSRPVAPVDAISPPLCWALLGISALIFLIQIWNYVVS